VDEKEGIAVIELWVDSGAPLSSYFKVALYKFHKTDRQIALLEAVLKSSMGKTRRMSPMCMK